MTVNHGVLGSSPCSGAFREFSSAGSEHLPYKQRVGGSNPSTPTKPKASNSDAFLFCGSILPTIFTFPPLCPLPLGKGEACFIICKNFGVVMLISQLFAKSNSLLVPRGERNGKALSVATYKERSSQSVSFNQTIILIASSQNSALLCREIVSPEVGWRNSRVSAWSISLSAGVP